MEGFMNLSILSLASLMERKHAMLKAKNSEQGNKQTALRICIKDIVVGKV